MGELKRHVRYFERKGIYDAEAEGRELWDDQVETVAGVESDGLSIVESLLSA
jgi:hypothetical protein